VDDDRIWAFETSLWLGGADEYRGNISTHCLMALPAAPYLFDGASAVTAVVETPRWLSAELSDHHVSRIEDGLIVVSYHVIAEREDRAPYDAYCTSVYAKDQAGDWKVIQHQQTPKISMKAGLAESNSASS
jgi:hypothetical protein